MTVHSFILTFIIEDLSINVYQAGHSIRVVTVVSGITGFVGSAILDRLGIKRMMALAMWVLKHSIYSITQLFNMMEVPAAELVSMVEAKIPAFAGAANLFGFLNKNLGMQTSFQIFGITVVVCLVIAAFILTEPESTKSKEDKK